MKKKKQTALWEWQLKSKSGTEKCKCGEVRDLNVDHIVPMSILIQFPNGKEYGYELNENFQILCKYCNQLKAGRLDLKNPKTYEVMEKILSEAKQYYL
jgi:5-methylcytosine-specific restriction endonuclease McrA